jgi:hypothetical protein
MPKMKIVSDGTPQGTIVYDQNGQKMNNVARVQIYMDCTEIKATVELIDVEFVVINIDPEIERTTVKCQTLK